MIQAGHKVGLHYAFSFIPAADAGARVARAVQSAAARDLLERLRTRAGEAAGASSKSHARSLAAAALAPQGAVGIDVEYWAPGRPITAIARYLMGSPVRDDAAAYRVFTFREAYFKASGVWPARAVLRLVADTQQGRYRAADFNVLHEPIGHAFSLTFVWSGDGEPLRVAL